MARQFQDDNFPSLSGARIVRIATHPNYQSMGYGSRALELLQHYYEMKIPNIEDVSSNLESSAIVDDEEVDLLEETVKLREFIGQQKRPKPQKEALALSEVKKMITANDLGRLKSFTDIWLNTDLFWISFQAWQNFSSYSILPALIILI